MTETQIFVSDEMAEMMNQKFKLDDDSSTSSKTSTDDNNDDDDDDAGNNADKNKNTNQSANDFSLDLSNTSTNNDDDDDKDDDNSSNLKPTALEILVEEYGYAGDDDFKELDLKDNSVDAIKKFYEIRDVKKAKEVAQAVLDADEDVKSLVEWKKQGKSINSWKLAKEAESFELNLEDTDIEGHEKFVRSVYEQQGIKGKKLDVIIEQLKDDDELLTESNQFQESIKENLKQQADFVAKQEAEAAKIEAANRDKEILEINNIIKAGKLADRLVIPENDRESFNKYLFSKDREDKWNKLDTSTQLFLEYLLYKDFNIKGVENKKPIVNTSNRTAPLANKNSSSDDETPTMSFEELRKRTRKTA